MMISAPRPIDFPYDIAAVLIGILLIVVAILQWRKDRPTRSAKELRDRRRNYFPFALVLGIAVFLIPDVGGDYLTFSLMAVGIAIHLYRLRRGNVKGGAI